MACVTHWMYGRRKIEPRGGELTLPVAVNTGSSMPAIISKSTRRSVKRKKASTSAKSRAQSAYERFKPYIGVISGPGDLSTNPKYMEGYGESRRP